MIEQGATPISSSEDLLKALGFDIDEKPKSELVNLSPKEQEVVDLIKIEPISRDELTRSLEIPITEINTLLATMELKGLIKETLGEINLI